MNDILYRIGKIATSQKLPDRFLTIDIHEPSDEEKGFGTLYFLIEIKTPWFPATEIGKEIKNSIIENFYGGKTYKLTGTFAPLNQLLGIFYE